MSSGQEKLRATVRELERELSAAHHLDAESRALLSQAASEIHDVLARRDNSTNGTIASGSTASGSTVSGSTVSGSTVSGSTVSGSTASGSTASDAAVSDAAVSDATASDSAASSRGQAGDESGTPPGGGSLINRVNEAARRFEASHPLLSGILEQIAESLGQMGI